jgi:transcriptional regulator with XRE-family HTH domain
MDVSLLIRHRLKKLGLDQKDLAAAAQVTDSYISQLLARKKTPPSPTRTGIYEKIGAVLKLPTGELSRLADLQREEQRRRSVADFPRPLFPECRELILCKCDAARQKEVRRIFEKDPFGELERLVAQTLLQVAQGMASIPYTSIFDIPVEGCSEVLEPMLESWDIDLDTFGITVVPNRLFSPASPRRFEFVERQMTAPAVPEPGLEQFLNDSALSGDATEEEIAFVTKLRPPRKRPSPIYYYRELQNLRDPLHFPSAEQSGPA